MACVYCAKGVKHGASLSLDHLKARSKTGKPNNLTRNLLTACMGCNTVRSNRPLRVFCEELAITIVRGRNLPFHDFHALRDDMLRRVSRNARRNIAPYTEQAKALLKARPFVKVMRNFEKSKRKAA